MSAVRLNRRRALLVWMERFVNAWMDGMGQLGLIHKVSQLVSWCFEPSQPQKDYCIRAEHKLQSISKVFIHCTTSLFCSKHSSNSINNFGTQNQKNNNTCFAAYLYSAGTQHGDLHHLSVKMSRVVYFILQAHTGTGVSWG